MRYCLKNKKICDYSNTKMNYKECQYEQTKGKTYDTCEYATKKFVDIIKTFNDDDYEIFGKELLLYENNKYIRENIRFILDICYVGRAIESSMEDLEKIFFKEYALKMIKEKTKNEYKKERINSL